MTSPDKPLLIYDGDCGFCRYVVERWRHRTGTSVDYAPFQEVAARFPDIPAEAWEQSVQLVLPTGERYEGAEAVFRTLALAPRRGWCLALYRRVPGFAPVAERVYALVSRNRHRISPWLSRLWDPARPGPETYFLSRRLFLTGLGLIYTVAFASLGVQVTGLVGEEGIWPAARVLEQAGRLPGAEAFWEFPTLFWWNAGDAALQGVCWAGVLLGLLSLTGRASAVVFLLLWALYLSLVAVGGEFMLFQWDTLLLEAGFLAVFLCPFRLRRSGVSPPAPSKVMIWLVRWLLFRLMFLSGVVKLASGDPAWRSLDALRYHYETQPLPTWIGWYVHQWPAGFHKFSTLLMFVIELLVPFFIFGSRRLRQIAFVVFAGFQALIFLTGNYCFFNLLSALLGVMLLDDRLLALFWPGRGWVRSPDQPVPAEPVGQRLAVAALALVVVLASGDYFARLLVPGWNHPEGIGPVLRLARSLRWVNPYGLFAVMTTERREIILEGSNDGREWRAYEFKWKPGDVRRAPGFVAPHQPRLDWQMWFAALGTFEQNPWLARLMVSLLRGSAPVLSLLETNPFPDSPPKYLRAVLYDYRFTDAESRRRTGAWWRRKRIGAYSPYLKLRQTEWPREKPGP